MMGGDTRSVAARKLAAERAHQAHELRLRGAAFRDIAQKLGLTFSGAYRAHRRELLRLPESSTAMARKEQIELMNRMLAKLCSQLSTATRADDVTKIIREIVRVETRRAKLCGLDLQAKDMSAQSAEELEDYKQRERDRQKALFRSMTHEERQTLIGLVETAEARLKEEKSPN